MILGNRVVRDKEFLIVISSSYLYILRFIQELCKCVNEYRMIELHVNYEFVGTVTGLQKKF